MWTKTTVAITAIATLLVASVAYAFMSGKKSGMQEIQTQWDQSTLEIQQATIAAAVTARAKETALQTKMDQLTRTYHHDKARIATQHTALVDSLRNRPAERASNGGVPEGASAESEPAGWCTGARLYREHATAFAGESAIAARTQAALAQCVAAYNAIREETQWPSSN